MPLQRGAVPVLVCFVHTTGGPQSANIGQVGLAWAAGATRRMAASARPPDITSTTGLCFLSSHLFLFNTDLRPRNTITILLIDDIEAHDALPRPFNNDPTPLHAPTHRRDRQALEIRDKAGYPLAATQPENGLTSLQSREGILSSTKRSSPACLKRQRQSSIFWRLCRRRTTHHHHHALINTPLHRQRVAGVGTHRHHIPRVERKQPAHKRRLSLWHAMDVSMSVTTTSPSPAPLTNTPLQAAASP